MKTLRLSDEAMKWLKEQMRLEEEACQTFNPVTEFCEEKEEVIAKLKNEIESDFEGMARRLNIQDGDLILIGNLDNNGFVKEFNDRDIEILSDTLHKLYPDKKFRLLTNFTKTQVDSIKFMRLQDGDIIICPDNETRDKFIHTKYPVKNVTLIVSDKEIEIKKKENTTETIASLEIGKYRVSRDSDGGIWIEGADGEGGQFDEPALEKLIAKFYSDNF